MLKSIEEDFKKEIMNVHYVTYMDTPSTRILAPGAMNFGRPFLVHHSYILGLSVLCLGVEKTIFNEIIQFTG